MGLKGLSEYISEVLLVTFVGVSKSFYMLVCFLSEVVCVPLYRVVVCIDWIRVEDHYVKQQNNPRRLRLDPEALFWVPLVYGHNISTSTHADSDEVKSIFLIFFFFIMHIIISLLKRSYSSSFFFVV